MKTHLLFSEETIENKKNIQPTVEKFDFGLRIQPKISGLDEPNIFFIYLFENKTTEHKMSTLVQMFLMAYLDLIPFSLCLIYLKGLLVCQLLYVGDIPQIC